MEYCVLPNNLKKKQILYYSYRKLYFSFLKNTYLSFYFRLRFGKIERAFFFPILQCRLRIRPPGRKKKRDPDPIVKKNPDTDPIVR